MTIGFVRLPFSSPLLHRNHEKKFIPNRAISSTISTITKRTRSLLPPLNYNPRTIEAGSGYNTYIKFPKGLMDHKLLGASDELDLSRQFQLGVQIKAQRDHMQNTTGQVPSDSDLAGALGIEPAQVKYFEEKGDNARSILIQANMRLVFHIAKYYRHRGLPYPDIVQEGTFGLMKAVDKYDPDRGFRFSTYASWWIKQSVSRAIAEKSRLVRLPVHIHDLMVTLHRAQKTFMTTHDRKPTAEELAEILALPLRKVELLVRCHRDIQSSDDDQFQSKGPNEGASRLNSDLMESTNVDPSEMMDKISLRSELKRAMSTLTEREAQVIQLRFGLSDGFPKTLKDIGEHFGVTRERIRQIEARALSKMRYPNKAHSLKEMTRDQSSDAYEQLLEEQLELEEDSEALKAISKLELETSSKVLSEDIDTTREFDTIKVKEGSKSRVSAVLQELNELELELLKKRDIVRDALTDKLASQSSLSIVERDATVELECNVS